jgi:hypothetical protein
MTCTLLRHLLDLPDSSRLSFWSLLRSRVAVRTGCSASGRSRGSLNDLFNPQMLPELAFSTRQFSFRQIAAAYVWQRTERFPA